MKIFRKLGQIAGALCAITISHPVQTGLILINYFLYRSAKRALQRARFAASVRLVKDLRTEEDLRYLLGRLPQWITAPDWERGDSVQVLLGLLWPAINSTVCSILKRELEERVQESSDFGHISFSRLSFGRNPPTIVAIKAVPLHGEDLLAMVLDVDVRWAGEPDVALHLTKLGGASLGLSDVQLAGIVRLVFTPLTETPPFFRRMTVSLLNRPYVDFSVRALGGPDLMSLPAISSWLHSVVMSLADKAIVWPKEVGVPLCPPPAAEAAAAAAAEAAALLPPMGVLIVRVVSADIEPRRSTFLGRLKLPSPRVSLVLPEATGRDGAEEGVMQAGLTPVREKTLKPEWTSQFSFVVSRPEQHVRLLLTHKRMDLLGADMPLGLAELSIADILDDYHIQKEQEERLAKLESLGSTAVDGMAAAAAAAVAEVSIGQVDQKSDENNATVVTIKTVIPSSNGDKSTVAAMKTPVLKRKQDHHDKVESPTPSKYSIGEEGYASASSSPRVLSRSSSRSRSISPARSMSSPVVWASPAASRTHPDTQLKRYHRTTSGLGTGAATTPSAKAAVGYERRTVTWTASTFGSSNSLQSLANGTGSMEAHAGLGLLLDDASANGFGSAATDAGARHWTPPHHQQHLRDNRPSAVTPIPTPFASAFGTSTTTTTMTSSVTPLQQQQRSFRSPPQSNGPNSHKVRVGATTQSSWLAPEGVWIEIPSSSSMTMAGMVTDAAEGDPSGSRGQTQGTTSGTADESSRGWFKSLQALVLGEYDDDLAEYEGLDSVGKVKLEVKWLPVAPAPLPVSPRPPGEEGSKRKGRKSVDSRKSMEKTPSEVGLGECTSDILRRSSIDASGILPSPASASQLLLSPRPTQPSQAGVLAIRVAYTKLDYGDNPSSPVLALSVGLNPGASMASIATTTVNPPQRSVSMDCQIGGRPGLLHWGRVFHIPVWDVAGYRAVLELGNAVSSLKLSTYGSELYALDMMIDEEHFEADVEVEAAASIPLKDVVAKGVVRGTWRLREARGRRGGGVSVGNDEHENLDVGRVALVMAWFPLS